MGGGTEYRAEPVSPLEPRPIPRRRSLNSVAQISTGTAILWVPPHLEELNPSARQRLASAPGSLDLDSVSLFEGIEPNQKLLLLLLTS